MPAVPVPSASLWTKLTLPLVTLTQGHPLYYLLPKLAIGLIVLYCLIAQRHRLGRLLALFGHIPPIGRLASRLGQSPPLLRIWSVVQPGLLPAIHGFLMAGLVTMTFFAAANYLDWGRFRNGRYLNAYEFYHYYLGTKYAPEIGYTGLYAASLIADDETGMKYSNEKKSIRNLSTGGYIAVADVLKHRDHFKVRFSPERWNAWVRDVGWFKKEMSTGRWNSVLRDKGYNASPVWSAIVGGLLTNRFPTESEAGMNFLAVIDLLLISAAFVCVFWAFGPRSALLLLLLLGTHYMMHFSHMKGALMRTDFAVALVLAVCLVKKERYGLAGFFVAYSFLARVFPGVFLFGLGAKLLWDLLRVARQAAQAFYDRYGEMKPCLKALAFLVSAHAAGAIVLATIYVNLPAPLLMKIPTGLPVPWSFRLLVLFPGCLAGLLLCTCAVWGLWRGLINRNYLRFFGAFAVSVVLLVSASIAYSGGLYLWRDFGSKIGRHNQDISGWRIGFKYLFMSRFKPDFDWEKAVSELIYGPAPETKAASTKPGVKALAATQQSRAAIKKFAPQIQGTIYRDHQRAWWTIQAAVLLICILAVKGLKDWQALSFSFVPMFFLVAPTYYYFIILLVPMLFFTAEMERPSRAMGLVGMFLTAMAGYYLYGIWSQEFPTYYWLSWMIFLFVVYMALLALLESFWFRPALAAPGTGTPEEAAPCAVPVSDAPDGLVALD